MTKLRRWKVLKEEDISPSKYFPLYKQKIKYPNGKIEEDFYISKLGDVATTIALMADKKVLIVRQYKHGFGDITIEFPAGRIKKGEVPLDCAKRELLEETGYRAKQYIPIGLVCPSPTKDTAKVYGFIALELERINDPILEPTFDSYEEIEILEYTLSEIKQLIKNNKMRGSDAIALLTLAELKHPELFRE